MSKAHESATAVTESDLITPKKSMSWALVVVVDTVGSVKLPLHVFEIKRAVFLKEMWKNVSSKSP